jgi:hypothetical protein
MKESDIYTTNWEWDKYINDYWPILDMVISQVTWHWVILSDTSDEYYLQYQVSETIWDKYITIVTDNRFEQTVIESVEDLADVIIDQQEAFDNIIILIKQSWVTE